MSTNKGIDKSFCHQVSAKDEGEAAALYEEVRARLLNINEWHYYAGKGTAIFQRMNAEGLALTGTVTLHDFVRIDIPGPGSRKGFDWVQVEEWTEEEDRTCFRVRPCADPAIPAESTAHFLSAAASSTFIVEKAGLVVRAKVIGKNEQPNTEGETLIKKARDLLVGLGALAGASDIQWSRLVKGLVEKKEE